MISVIMSTYNNQNSVGKSIESILNQTYKNFELLIMNDGSTDNTKKVLDKYLENEKVKIFTNSENQGLTKSLNTLINKSKGKFIARQDSDDISFNMRLEKQLNFMEKHNLDACTSRAINKQTRKKVPGLSYYLPYKLSTKFKNPFIHGTLMIKSNVLKELMYDEEFYYSQDFVLFLSLIKNFDIKTMNSCLYELNTKNNISEKFKKEQKKYFNLARKRNI